MISVIIPAHNEEHWIGACVQSVRESFEHVVEPYEVIVVDDASTDATNRIARELVARTLRVEYRNIAAVRNAGAREAKGNVFFFVDADTQLNRQAVAAACEALRTGAAGGGFLPIFDVKLPLWAKWFYVNACLAGRLLRQTGGCFLFCTREAFDASGGFRENIYTGEDVAFGRAVNKVGRFVVPGPKVVTSGRKIDMTNPWNLLHFGIGFTVHGPGHQTKWMHDMLYGERAQKARDKAKTGENGKRPG